MRVIVGKRGSGKTDALIEIAGKEFAYIVVADHRRATAVHHRSKEMGVDIPFPLTYEEFRRGLYYGRNIKAFVVDDVDDLVRKMAGDVPVLAISATEADEQVDGLLAKLMRSVRGQPPEKIQAYRTVLSSDLPAGAIEVPADMQDLVERLIETQRQRQEEAFRCLGVPANWIGDDGGAE